MSVIVTNAKSRIAYNIVKSLGKRGIDVHTSDFVPLSMSFASRYSKSNFLYPSPFKYQKGFIESLIKNITRLKTDVLIPVFEETFLISKYKTELMKHVKLVIAEESFLSIRGMLKRRPNFWSKTGQLSSALHINANPPLETSTITPSDKDSAKSSANKTGHL